MSKGLQLLLGRPGQLGRLIITTRTTPTSIARGRAMLATRARWGGIDSGEDSSARGERGGSSRDRGYGGRTFPSTQRGGGFDRPRPAYDAPARRGDGDAPSSSRARCHSASLTSATRWSHSSGACAVLSESHTLCPTACARSGLRAPTSGHGRDRRLRPRRAGAQSSFLLHRTAP